LGGAVNVGNTVGVDVLTLPAMPPPAQQVINVAEWTVWEDNASSSGPPMNVQKTYGLSSNALIHKVVMGATRLPGSGSIKLSVGSNSGGSFNGKLVASTPIGEAGVTVLDFNPPLFVDQSQYPILELRFTHGSCSTSTPCYPSENAQVYFSDAP
jgi:hypothetical protein